jgi:hypothetical protein
MTAQVRIVVGSKTDVLRIPTAALRFRPDEDELKAPPGAATGSVGRGQQCDRGPRPTTTACWRHPRRRAVFRVYTVGEGSGRCRTR